MGGLSFLPRRLGNTFSLLFNCETFRNAYIKFLLGLLEIEPKALQVPYTPSSIGRYRYSVSVDCLISIGSPMHLTDLPTLYTPQQFFLLCSEYTQAYGIRATLSHMQ